MEERVKKMVLAYSGGLDTSIILRWLIESYRLNAPRLRIRAMSQKGAQP